jgi:predicted dehydrogenase
VPSYVGALYEFRDGGLAQATFSFDSHLERSGVVEIAGTLGSLIAPDPNMFGGLVEVVRAEQGERATVRSSVRVSEGRSGRGIGVLDMARAIRAGEPHRASGRVALHVLDALLATEESIASGGFVDVTTDLVVPPVLPVDWDPVASTLA